ncbi:MAG: hypothetical protein HPY44_13795 [Armatimonadetes bacterium]|nr:hypothetical protein [Armatimonadota bacterium]
MRSNGFIGPADDHGKPFSSHRKDWPWLVGLCGLIFLIHAPVLLGRLVYFHDDQWLFFLPTQDFMRRCVFEGNWFPWCPWIGCGYPISADPQVGRFYPPNLLLLLPASTELLMGWNLWLHYCIAAVGMFVLARRLGALPLGAFCAGAIFANSGFMIAHLHHYVIIQSAAWFPWAWYAILNYRLAGGWRNLALLAWCIVAQTLVGHPHELLLTSCSGFILLALCELMLPDMRSTPGLRLRRWSVLVSVLVLGVGLAGVMLVPTIALHMLTVRSEPSLSFITSIPITRDVLWTFVNVRGTQGAFWEREGFAGFSTLALLPLAALSWRRRKIISVLLILMLIAFAMGMSQINPIYRVVLYIPFLNSFRAAARWLLVISACVSLLIAIGLTTLPESLKTVRWIMWLAAAAVVCETGVFAWNYNPRIAADAREQLPSFERGDGGGRYLLRRPPEEGLSVVEITLLRAQMAYPNSNLLWDLPTVDGYTPMRLKHFAHARMMADIPHNLTVSALFGCRWIIERRPGPGGGSTVVSRENPEYRGLAWLASRTATEAKFEAVLRGEDVSDEPFATAYLPEGTGIEIPRVSRASGGAARVISEGTRGVVAQCEARAPGILVLAYTWIPWLEARVNSKPAPLHRCNIAFCAVEVPAGNSRVELVYHHPHLWAGIAVTVLSALILGLVLWCEVRRPGE